MISGVVHSCLVDPHIELNPVRAGMVDDPTHYRWSSYRHNTLGQADRDLSPHPHPLYLALGKDDKARQVIYRGLFRAGLDNEAISDIRAWRSTRTSRWAIHAFTPRLKP